MKRFSLIAVFFIIFGALAGCGDSRTDYYNPPIKQYPSDVLDLRVWKLTLPYSTDDSENPGEIVNPELMTFSDHTSFFLNTEKNAVVFKANSGGVSTPGSKYPRSELREMLINGEKADWGTDDGGTHIMEAQMVITHLPEIKQHVVAAQIHDAEDDVMMIRLEGSNLFIERNSLDEITLDKNYQLSTRFSLRIEAAERSIKVWYNNVLKMDWQIEKTGCYFKAGCYVQSNTSTDDPSAYGEVYIYDLIVRHY